MNSPRFFFLAITYLLFFTSGCTAERAGNAGFISVSQPRVWRDEATVTSIGNQLKEINKFGEDVNLSAIQGKRARRFYKVLGLKGAVGLTLPASSPAPTAKPSTQEGTGDGTSIPAADSASTQEEVKGSPKSGLPEYIKISGEADESKGFTFQEFSDIGEEPIDRLQRVDDFYQILEGVRLTHLRDTASMEKEWSAYLLGFDVSLVPGDKTSEGYGARVEFEITGKDEKEDKDKKEDWVEVYSIWPQRYAERFNEILAVRESFYLALKETVRAQVGSAELAQDLAEKYQDDLALIQRYPLISGFVKGPRSFGWEFNPRVHIKTIRRPILPSRAATVYWMEPGIRRCYAIVAVNDGRVWAEKFLSEMTEEDLKKIASGDRANLIDREGLKEMYKDVINNMYVEPYSSETVYGKYLEHSKEVDKLRRLINEAAEELKILPNGVKSGISLPEGKKIQYNASRKLLIFTGIMSPDEKTQLLGLSGDEQYKEAVEKLFEKSKNNKDLFGKPIGTKEEELEKWKDFHKHVLRLCGHHGWGGIKKLELKATCKWFHLDSGQEVEASCKPFGGGVSTICVELPNKQHRSLEKIWKVWPDRGSVNQEVTVTIRGMDISNDARVFVGGMEAKKVDVVSRNLVVATFPKTGEEILEGLKEKKFPIKVLTAGDSLGAVEAFTYFKPEEPAEEPAFEAHLGTTKGKANTPVEIKANRPVMDSVAKVLFGQYEASASGIIRGVDKHELMVIAPAGPKEGEGVPIILIFTPQTGISRNNEYLLPNRFQYEKEVK